MEATAPGSASSGTKEMRTMLSAPRGFVRTRRSGSLPTPPCTEDVIWAVMKTPVGMSADQLAVFARLHTGNSRPLQDTNGRPILESR